MSQNQDPLYALTTLDGRYKNKVQDLFQYWSEAELIKTRTEIEVRYLIALSTEKVIRPLTKKEIASLEFLCNKLAHKDIHRIKEIEGVTHHDVKAVELFLREVFKKTSLEDLAEYIHIGLTSEDINNLSYRLMAQRAKDKICVPLLDQLINSLIHIADSSKELVMLGRTHGQAAVPTTLGKEIVVFAWRLNKQVRKLASMRLTGKLNGAVGNYNAHTYAFPKVDWIGFSNKFIKSLGLEPNPITTQINSYEDFVELFHRVIRVNGVLIDLNQDMWRYISDGWFGQEARKGEVGSSTMPQKINPIQFENSEANLQMATGMLETMGRKLMQSRLQRDLSDSTTIRNVGSALGYGVLAYKNTMNGLSRIAPHKKNIQIALNENWTVLSEGVQTLLRTQGIEDPYSLLSSLTKGEKINGKVWKKWVADLPDDIDERTKEKLLKLSPEKYIGEAIRLTEIGIKEIKTTQKS